MAEILGNKLKINSIDIIPSTINHNDEYLKVAGDETKYEYISTEDVKNNLSISTYKNATVNEGFNKAYDTCLSEFSTGLLTSNYSKGYKVTTNGTQRNSSYPLSNLYTSFQAGYFQLAKGDNIYIQLQTPIPIAYTKVVRRIGNWFGYFNENYEPSNFIVEASNDGVNFDVLLNYTITTMIPLDSLVFPINENKVKYLYWRIRYPKGGNTCEIFSYWLIGEPQANLFSQSEFQKNKLVKLYPYWLNPLIPYRTSNTDKDNIGTVSGSSNITEYNTNNQIWQAFRGNVNTSNQGWLSADTQTLPCDLIYTPTEIYTPGYYMFTFKKGIWEDNWGYTPLNVQIIIVDENNIEHTVWHRAMHLISQAYFATENMYIPYKFKQVKWRIHIKYSTMVSMGYCQIYKCLDISNYSCAVVDRNKNILNINKGNNLQAGGYLHTPVVEFNVNEDNPLIVTFPDNSKKTFTSLSSMMIKPQKKFRLITPKHLTSNTYDSTIFNELKNNQEYIDTVQGTCTGIGSILSDACDFWKAICTDVRSYNDCWSTSSDGELGGPIYKWNKLKTKGKYVFKFNTGWWNDNNGYPASEVKVSVRNGDTDTWKTVWNINDIPNTYSTYWWSPVIDIDFEFNQVYFEIVSLAGQHYGNLVGCAVYQECDYDYLIMNDTNNTDDNNQISERAYQYAYDYQESQNLYITKEGTTYGLSNLVYRQPEEPVEPKEYDVWYNNKQEPLRVYQYKDGGWTEFNDVLLGNFNLINGLIQTFHENPYNDNGTFKNSDCIWSSELALTDEASVYDGDIFTIKNTISNVYHNLNIQDTTKYKADCYLKCVTEDCGYEPGDIAMGTTVLISSNLYTQPIPYLTKNTIGIWTSSINSGWQVIHKWSGQVVNANSSYWRLVFKIREL